MPKGGPKGIYSKLSWHVSRAMQAPDKYDIFILLSFVFSVSAPALLDCTGYVRHSGDELTLLCGV